MESVEVKTPETSNNSGAIVLSKKFVVFNHTEASLSEFVNDYKNLVITEENFKDGKGALRSVREKRYEIQNIQKENNAICNDIKRQNSDIGAKLINIISPVEGKIKEQIDSIEAKRKAIKAEKERKKAEQMAKWNKKAQSILEYTDKLLECDDLNTAEQIIKEISNIEISEKEYGAYELIAKQNKEKTLGQAERVRIRLEEEAKAKEIKAQHELVLAKEKYMEYFHCKINEIPEDHTTESLIKAVEDAKQDKLDFLTSLEEVDKKRKAEEQPDKPELPEKPSPKLSMGVALENIKIVEEESGTGDNIEIDKQSTALDNDMEALLHWRNEIQEVIDAMPELSTVEISLFADTVNEKLKEIVDAFNMYD
mgnify:FL=1